MCCLCTLNCRRGYRRLYTHMSHWCDDQWQERQGGLFGHQKKDDALGHLALNEIAQPLKAAGQSSQRVEVRLTTYRVVNARSSCGVLVSCQHIVGPLLIPSCSR